MPLRLLPWAIALPLFILATRAWVTDENLLFFYLLLASCVAPSIYASSRIRRWADSRSWGVHRVRAIASNSRVEVEFVNAAAYDRWMR